MKSKGKIEEGKEMNKLRVKGKEVEKKGGSPPPDRVREPIKFWIGTMKKGRKRGRRRMPTSRTHPMLLVQEAFPQVRPMELGRYAGPGRQGLRVRRGILN